MASKGAQFPKRRVFWRTYYSAEQAQGRLLMLILTPAVGAFTGTAYAVSHPSTVVLHQGVSSLTSSFWDTLLLALAGSVLGLVLLTGVVFSGIFAWYHWKGDSVWKAVYTGAVDGLMFFELQCKDGLFVDPAVALGQHVECRVKTPSGKIVTPERLDSRGDPNGIIARFVMDPTPGEYEVRWCAKEDNPRFHEIARQEATI
jgi:hypothetical protein